MNRAPWTLLRFVPVPAADGFIQGGTVSPTGLLWITFVTPELQKDAGQNRWKEKISNGGGEFKRVLLHLVLWEDSDMTRGKPSNENRYIYIINYKIDTFSTTGVFKCSLWSDFGERAHYSSQGNAQVVAMVTFICSMFSGSVQVNVKLPSNWQHVSENSTVIVFFFDNTIKLPRHR